MYLQQPTKGHHTVKSATLKKKILAHFNDAKPLEVLEGAQWYDSANSDIQALATAYDMPARTVAGVVAVLSPRMRWSENISEAASIIQQYYADVTAESAHSITFLQNVRKAYSVLAGDDSAIRGPKVTAFYRNLLGDPTVVTVDIWAIRAAIGKTLRDSKGTDRAPNKTEQAAITKAYETAAREVGISPAKLQAIVWVVVRNRWPARSGK